MLDNHPKLKYGDLVVNPVSELTSIPRFLDLPYSDDMANYYAGKTRKESSLSAEDIQDFEGIAGDLLRDNGYPCRVTLAMKPSPPGSSPACNGRTLRAGAETTPPG